MSLETSDEWCWCFIEGSVGMVVSEECDAAPCAPKVAPLLWTFRTTEPSCDSECSRNHAVCATTNGLPARCSAPARHSTADCAGWTPLRFFKVATGWESKGDEFGVLEDDRRTDTGVFQQSYLVHELVLACSPPPPPRPQISYTVASRASSRSSKPRNRERV